MVGDIYVGIGMCMCWYTCTCRCVHVQYLHVRVDIYVAVPKQDSKCCPVWVLQQICWMFLSNTVNLPNLTHSDASHMHELEGTCSYKDPWYMSVA